MDDYHIFLVMPCCKRCKESKTNGNTDYYKDALTNVCEKIKSCDDQELPRTKHYGIPEVLFDHCNQYGAFVHPQIKFDDCVTEDENRVSQKATWIKLSSNNPNSESILKTMLERIEEFMPNECSDEDIENYVMRCAENVSEQLHQVADDMPCMGHKLDVYWIICEHSECIDISNLLPVFGALKRLQLWNSASITFFVDQEGELCHSSCEQWSKGLDILLMNIHQTTQSIVNSHIAWTGLVTCIDDQNSAKTAQPNPDWILSRTNPSSLQSTSVSPISRTRNRQTVQILDNSITVICEIARQDIPLWKILPSKFILYHNTLTKRVFESGRLTATYEELDEFENNEKETVLLASLESCTSLNTSLNTRKTKDWIKFVETGVTNNHEHPGETACKRKTNETFYLVLYPVEPGIFDVFFIRPETSFCVNLNSMIAVHEATSLTKSKRTSLVLPGISFEKQWLKCLDDTFRVASSPFKTQLSLAVHLDASEMLKHFSKDGKPLKKELEALRKQVEERKMCSSAEKEKEKTLDREQDIEANVSQDLLPKHVQHETLSLCNTPKTLAKARSRQATKRKAAPGSEKKTPDDDSEIGHQASSSSDKMSSNPKAKKPKLSTKSQSDLPKKISKGKLTKQKKKASADDATKPVDNEKVKKKKRRSFDGSETSLGQANTTDTKEKRSDRHKRRLARVVKRALIKYGVETQDEYFDTCSERLYYLCKSFLKDLKTSEGLNTEMKRLAESNVANVVEFEKRRWEESQLTKDKTNSEQK